MKKDFNEFKEYIRGKKVGVLGIGVSNQPLIQFLIQLGAEVTAFDKKTEEQLGAVIEELRSKGVKFELGENYLNRLEGFDVIFKTPGMRIDIPALLKAKENGAYITSEMEEFVKYCPAKIYAVTGSDGKTTTTTIIYNLLEKQGYITWVGGNIGTPLFSRIEEIREEHKVVLELSSFQLMTMDTSPEVAVVTNLSPNHLDMHKGMEEYVDSKKNIFKYQNAKDSLILNRENDITYSFKEEAKGLVKLFSSKREIVDGAYLKDNTLYVKGKAICTREEIAIKGMHNVENYLAAFLATSDDVSKEVMANLVKTFTGVDHRCQLIREVNGVRYYNDSIASSPTRTIASIKSFEKPVILLAGGYDKKIPFEPLAEDGNPYIKEIILMGDTKDKIRKVFEDLRDNKGINVPFHVVNSLEEAVSKAREIAEAGDYVVLSPACASFDAFLNFEVRGNSFKELVSNLN